jgi:hypothetical protein
MSTTEPMPQNGFNGGFTTAIAADGDTLAGPWCAPLQMLAEQSYDDHASIHDDATAQKLGFRGGTIEGPTHFSQFVPLGVSVWGRDFLERGCISAHYRNAVFEGEEVRALMARPPHGEGRAEIWMQKKDGTEVLRGSLSLATDPTPTALDQRLASLAPTGQLVILRDIRVGMRSKRQSVRMDFEQTMGALYPFSLKQKLQKMTQSSSWYSPEGGASSPWGQPIIPMEMISVLLNYTAKIDPFPVRGPVVGLFADQEIRLIQGPLLVGEDYEIDREVVALSESKRTESMWIRTRVYRPGSNEVIATMLLNGASLKDSFVDRGD